MGPEAEIPQIIFFVLSEILNFVFAFLMLFFGYFATTRLQTGFLPELDEGSIVLDYYSPPGTTIEETDSGKIESDSDGDGIDWTILEEDGGSL